jgi:hypothetical protein
MPQLIAALKTPVSPEDMWPVMADCFHTQYGAPPTSGQLLILMAQWCLETANGVDMVQYNVGNVKHVADDGLNWTAYTTTEYDSNGQPHVLTQLFKAYSTVEAGVNAYLSMFLGGRYSNAWPFVLDADPASFVHALAERGYFTAPESEYLAGVEARLGELEAMNLPDPSEGTS